MERRIEIWVLVLVALALLFVAALVVDLATGNGPESAGSSRSKGPTICMNRITGEVVDGDDVWLVGNTPNWTCIEKHR